MSMQALEDLLVHELHDLHSAEQQMVNGLSGNGRSGAVRAIAARS